MIHNKLRQLDRRISITIDMISIEDPFIICPYKERFEAIRRDLIYG
jgi:hypothetical protein